MTIGTRVEIHPATDAWMSGDRFGAIERIGKGRSGKDANGRAVVYSPVYVRMDKSGRLLRCRPDDLVEVG